jgi:hypothetical protein
MNIVPRFAWRYGEVNTILIRRGGMPIARRNDDRLGFTAETSVNAHVAASEGCNAKGAPKARRPPAAAIGFYPCGGRRQRKRMNYPGYEAIGV